MRVESKKKVATGWILGLFFLLVLALGLTLYRRALVKPLWSNKVSNLVLYDDGQKQELWLIEKGGGARYELPANLMLPVAQRSGELKLSSLLKFARDEGDYYNIVRRSVDKGLGLKLDGVIAPEGDSINWWYRLMVKSVASSLSLKKFEFLEEGIADGSMGTRLTDVEQIATVDNKNELVGVEVLNTSKTEGMALLAERMLVNLGYLVVAVGTHPEEYDGYCMVVGDQELLKSRIVEYLVSKWSCERLVDSEQKLDVKLLLGSKFAAEYQ